VKQGLVESPACMRRLRVPESRQAKAPTYLPVLAGVSQEMSYVKDLKSRNIGFNLDVSPLRFNYPLLGEPIIK